MDGNLTWWLLRTGELAEGRVAVMPRDGRRLAVVVLWCLILGAWIVVLKSRWRIEKFLASILSRSRLGALRRNPLTLKPQETER